MRLVALFAGALLAFAAQAQQDSPEALVKQVTSEVLQAIKEDPDLKAGDRNKALALAEQKVLPHVDFRRAVAMAAGRHWRAASAAQQDRLVKEFRAMLVRTYANAIDAYKGQTLKVLPVRMAKGDTEVTVRNQYLSPGRPPVDIDYQMARTPEGWKIYDIVVGGVSLVITYRSEFDSLVRSGGIDGLIKAMADKNAPAR